MVIIRKYSLAVLLKQYGQIKTKLSVWPKIYKCNFEKLERTVEIILWHV